MLSAAFWSMARTSPGTLGYQRIFLTPVSVVPGIADLIHGEAQVGHNLLERNAAFGVFTEVLARFGNCAAVLFSQWLVFRFDHDFEELQDGRDLIGPQLLDQLMNVLFGFRRINGHYRSEERPVGLDGRF